MRLRFSPMGWVSLATVLCTFQASANIEQQLAACAGKSDKLDRLVCYDNLAQSVKQVSPVTQVAAPVSKPAPVSSQAPTAAVVATPVVATAPQSAEDNFGKVYKEEKEEIDKLYLTVKSVSKDPRGTLKISFENGQVWKQNDSRRFKIKAGETVYIETGALGSFLLGRDDSNSTIRVKRLD
ncbi:hypothetical protein ACQKE0_05580 [Shewanella colwelliana]|uniref:hypothetical protein n=1 Tax=Shewanella colwelliana TaxID=23 RepID=UPI003CFC3345